MHRKKAAVLCIKPECELWNKQANRHPVAGFFINTQKDAFSSPGRDSSQRRAGVGIWLGKWKELVFFKKECYNKLLCRSLPSAMNHFVDNGLYQMGVKTHARSCKRDLIGPDNRKELRRI